MSLGYIYVLSNESMPGLLKIGMTTREIGERIKELGGSTGVPTEFKLEAYYISERVEEDEKAIHSILGEYRANRNREFFKMELDKALEILSNKFEISPKYLRSVEEIREDNKFKDEEISRLNTSLLDYKNFNFVLSARVECLKIQINELEKCIISKESEIKDLGKTTGSLKTDITNLKFNIKQNNKQITQYESEINNIKKYVKENKKLKIAKLGHKEWVTEDNKPEEIKNSNGWLVFGIIMAVLAIFVGLMAK